MKAGSPRLAAVCHVRWSDANFSFSSFFVVLPSMRSETTFTYLFSSLHLMPAMKKSLEKFPCNVDMITISFECVNVSLFCAHSSDEISISRLRFRNRKQIILDSESEAISARRRQKANAKRCEWPIGFDLFISIRFSIHIMTLDACESGVNNIVKVHSPSAERD